MPARFAAKPLELYARDGVASAARFVTDDETLDGARFVERVIALSRVIRATLRARRGSNVVCVACETSASALACYLAIDVAGGVAVGLNSRWTATEATEAAGRCDAACAMVDAKHFEMWGRDAFDGCANVIDVDDAVERTSEGGSEEMEKAREDGACAYCFTSGTTGAAKAAVLTHEGVLAATRAKIEVVGYERSDVYMHCAPLYHVGGLSSAHASMSAGASHVFMRSFDAERALGAIERSGVTAFIAVPTMMAMLVDAAGERVFDSVRKILVGAGRLRRCQYEAIRRVFPNAKVTMAYGMSETTSSVTFLDPEDGRLVEDPTFAGQAVRDVEVRADANGELHVRGPIVMLGYHGVDKSTTFDADGWFATGDLGRVAPAETSSACTGPRVWLYGRAKAVIKTGGENVSPEEVEGVINAHEDVHTSVVVGAPHEKWGETVVAIVKLRQGTSLSVDEARPTVLEWCRDSRLARFKIPKYILFTNEIPINMMGKFSRADVYDAHRVEIENEIASTRPVNWQGWIVIRD